MLTWGLMCGKDVSLQIPHKNPVTCYYNLRFSINAFSLSPEKEILDFKDNVDKNNIVRNTVLLKVT